MSGRMPVYRDEQFVGAILWNGGIASGSWVFRVSKELDELDQRRVRKQIQEIRQRRQDLEDIRYRSITDERYKGWSGFPGTLGAFEYALPAVGLRIDRSDVDWPPTELYDVPDGIDTESQERQDKQNEEIRVAEAEQELINFRDRMEQGSV